MSTEVEHRNTEHKVKCWLKDQYRSHRTEVDKFSGFNGNEYETQVSKLGVNILTLVIKTNGENQAKAYCSTPNLDWEIVNAKR